MIISLNYLNIFFKKKIKYKVINYILNKLGYEVKFIKKYYLYYINNNYYYLYGYLNKYKKYKNIYYLILNNKLKLYFYYINKKKKKKIGIKIFFYKKNNINKFNNYIKNICLRKFILFNKKNNKKNNKKDYLFYINLNINQLHYNYNNIINIINNYYRFYYNYNIINNINIDIFFKKKKKYNKIFLYKNIYKKNN
ncbi:MAG: hypothetical protein ABNO60_00360 [Candidatus Shikimatogenerans sp. Tcar]|uniref:Homing endonuclease LAGLIDADG domain-containing protein n=1 Tax=Candidatus Shikimatogenerans sp. Tcar TaxID=3158565 RepID=A0AAU7QSI0_9FLAO